IVVRDETIVFAGSVAESRDFAGAGAARVDLHGAYVVPGFTDSHIHTAQLALQHNEIDLSGAGSLENTLARVRDAIDARATLTPDLAADWLFGGRWNSLTWADTTLPTRWQLDSVTGPVPVALHHGDLHTFWLNSAALDRLGISAEDQDPIGGSYGRDGQGRLTGILGESAAFAAERFFADQTSAALDATLEATLARLLAHGVTTIHDIDGEDALRAFSALRSAGTLPLRVHKLMPVAALDALIDAGVTSGSGDAWLRYGAVKIFGDGSLSSHTCLLHEAYTGQPENFGVAVTPADLLNDLVARCNDNGLAVAVHCIGDGAATNALTALESSRSSGRPLPAVPNRIEHLQHVRAHDLARLGGLGVIACMQPASCTSDIDMVDDLLHGRDLLSYAWRSALEAGVHVAFSSDAPVESTNPFTGIHAAITRQRPDGTPELGWQPQERLSREQAFVAYTRAPAVASAESATKGALAPGFLADFAVLDRDPFAVDTTALLQTRVLQTVVGGQSRYTA
ncbi:MAG: amidohydrolase, partial [Cryobacterium sp.]